MPAFCARWPDGSFSIVDADDETHALIQLDELGEEPAQLWMMESCLLDFELTDNGSFRLKQFGEETGPEIMKKAYPLLNKALKRRTFEDHSIEDPVEPVQYRPAAKKILFDAVSAERERLKSVERTPAATEQGKALQRELGASAAYVDALVDQAASKHLKKFKPGDSVKPS